MAPGTETKPLVWLHGEIKTPPFSPIGRIIVYFLDEDAIVILEIFAKTTRATPIHIIETCRKRLAAYRRARIQERDQ